MYLLRIRRWAPQLGRRSLRTVSRWPASRFPSRQTVTPLFSVRKVYQPSLTRTTACIPTVSRQSTRSYSNRRKLRIIYDEDEDEEVYEPTHKNIEDHMYVSLLQVIISSSYLVYCNHYLHEFPIRFSTTEMTLLREKIQLV